MDIIIKIIDMIGNWLFRPLIDRWLSSYKPNTVRKKIQYKSKYNPIFKSYIRRNKGLIPKMERKNYNLSFEDTKKRIINSNDKDKDLILSYLYTGARCSELIRIREPVKSEGLFRYEIIGKGNKPRIIMTREPIPSKNISRTTVWRKCKKIAGCNPHALRHLYVTRASQLGYPDELISRSVGHADVKTTQIYKDYKDEQINLDASCDQRKQ